MGVTEIGEQIPVLAKFEQGKLLPLIIRWQGRRFGVKKLNLHHSQRKGTDTIHYFAISTEAGDCTIAYSQNDLSWKIVETYFQG